MSKTNRPFKQVLVSTLLAIILAIGAWAFWAAGFVVMSMVVNSLTASPFQAANLAFTVEGEPLIYSWQPPNYVNMNYRKLSGELIEDPEKLAIHKEEYMNTDLASPKAAELDRFIWPGRIRGWLSPRPALVNWYLLRDDPDVRLTYFVGYEGMAKRRVGYFGTGGFSLERPDVSQRFVIKSLWQGDAAIAPTWNSSSDQEPRAASSDEAGALFVVSDAKLYRIDLQRQNVTLIDLGAAVISVGTVSEPTAVADERKAIYKPRVVARFADHLQVLSFDGVPLHRIKLPERLRDLNLTLFDTVSDDWILVRNQHGAWNLPTELYWIDSLGDVKRHESVHFYRGTPDNPRWQAWMVALACPVPLVDAAMMLVGQPRSLQNRALMMLGTLEGAEPLDFGTALKQSVADFWMPVVAVLGLSAVLSVACYRRHRRYEKQGGLYWAAFVLIGGAPALVGYWLSRRWPATERCTSCGTLAPRDRETCRSCDEAFPLPALKGIEIFA